MKTKSVARPLAAEVAWLGLRVWFDEFELKELETV